MLILVRNVKKVFHDENLNYQGLLVIKVAVAEWL
jgi:hypothetical protein